jgi:hypothetical protein
MSSKCQIDITHTYDMSIKLVVLYHIQTMAERELSQVRTSVCSCVMIVNYHTTPSFNDEPALVRTWFVGISVMELLYVILRI